MKAGSFSKKTSRLEKATFFILLLGVIFLADPIGWLVMKTGCALSGSVSDEKIDINSILVADDRLNLCVVDCPILLGDGLSFVEFRPRQTYGPVISGRLYQFYVAPEGSEHCAWLEELSGSNPWATMNARLAEDECLAIEKKEQSESQLIYTRDESVLSAFLPGWLTKRSDLLTLADSGETVFDATTYTYRGVEKLLFSDGSPRWACHSTGIDISPLSVVGYYRKYFEGD